MPADRAEWFVVRTKPRKEELAEQSLVRRDITVFCPKILEPIGWRDDWTTVPLFPGYAFVRIDLRQEYSAVAWTPGISGFVSFGAMPSAIQPEVVDYLMGETGEDGIIKPAARLRPGERVRIKRGPLAGLVGIIDKPCSERGRIRVLMAFLRDDVPVELPVTAVCRV